MKKKLKLLVTALCLSPAALAQQADSLAIDMQSEQAFTFTEAQLGEDDDVTQNISVISSNRNVYASEVGYRFSPARFKYRAFNAKYNDIYINGNPVNDVERGEFRYSFVGGLNNQTRGSENTLPFEDNNYMMAGMAGSNNYDFRPSKFATGHRVSLAGANRNYNARAMYTYNTGLTNKGWAFTGSLTYRWGNGTGFVEGTSYNSLSYFLGLEKVFNDHHALSLVTWGNPTERGTQAASTDEMYWIANNNLYNPAWGYQDGKKRNSRIVKDFSPAALLTWDWKIDDQTKLVTSFLGKYSMYSSSRLNYNNSSNPAPDYYSSMPSYYFNVWDPMARTDRDEIAMGNWQAAYNYLSASKENRQINWDRLYFANRMASAQGSDAMYYLQRYHDDQLSFSLASTLKKALSTFTTLNAGLQLSTNKGMHYQTMDDLLGATRFHNVNTYVIKNYGENSPEAQYDLNNPNKVVGKGDRFGYDYNIYVNKAQLWAGLSSDYEAAHLFVNGRISGVTMQREGKMRNGLAPNNSFGKSGTAKFLDGGVKAGALVDLSRGHSLQFGLGYELKAPVARTAFQAAQINNDFVKDLKQEKIFSAELGYRVQTTWLKANLNAYYSHLEDVTEQSMYYMDDRRSFTYVSLSGIQKEYYGVELGMDFKITSWLNLKALGTISDAKYVNNANVSYMLSEDGKTYDDIVHNKGMREGCTPLTAGSLDLSIHTKGWYIDIIGNYYDRIYLYYTPVTRYESHQTSTTYDNDGNPIAATYPEQAKGKGGFMLDASIGKTWFLRHGRRLGVNLMVTNILNNTKIVTGGREQSRTDVDENGDAIRTYSFQNSPYKFYANGINGMLMINFQF
ncbi:MAG: TonB-dependent receptor [Prevotella sp.]|nr:TonB-dependent receptor [Prevotella sp.]